jgi:DNA-binding transcriptional MocR family regulator
MQRVLHATRVAELVAGFHREPAYRGLAEALRALISDGRIATGVRLPSERELTEALQVSRTTVTRAYAELREHGYLVSRQGSGWSATLPTSGGHRGDLLLPAADLPPGSIDLTCAAPQPTPGLLGLYQRAFEELPAHLAGTGYYPSGLPELRVAVADRYAERGLPTDPGQIVVVPGALAGAAVAAQLLVSAGDPVLVESPTYPNAVAAMAGRGGRVVGSDSDDWGEHGICADLRRTGASTAYLVPDFHNPTGTLRTDEERGRVAAALRRHDTVPVIDESIVDLSLDGAEMPTPFAAHTDRAVSIGSLSKAFWGGIRVGWLRVPASMTGEVVQARVALDLGVPPLEQLVAVELLRSGGELLAHRRDQLRESRDAALEAIAAHLPDWTPNAPTGGLSLWCRLPAPLSTALVPRAAAHGVALAAGPSFAPEGGLNHYMRIPYALPAHVLREAVERLGIAWQETLARPELSARTPTLVA